MSVPVDERMLVVCVGEVRLRLGFVLLVLVRVSLDLLIYCIQSLTAVVHLQFLIFFSEWWFRFLVNFFLVNLLIRVIELMIQSDSVLLC